LNATSRSQASITSGRLRSADTRACEANRAGRHTAR
jgi:hypothetical protein